MPSVWDPYQKSQARAIEILLRKKELEEDRRRFQQQMQMQIANRQQEDRKKMLELTQKTRDAKIKNMQDMLKTAYEKGDVKGVQAYGQPLANMGYTVPARQMAGPVQPGENPPLEFFAAPQKPGMSEAELTQRAIGGDQLAKSILDRMAARKKQTAKAGSSNITVDVGDKSMTELGKEMSKSLVSERTDVEGAVKSLENLKSAKKLLDAGIITGTGAEFVTSFGNLLYSRLGFKAAGDPVANTQAFAATMGTQVGQIIKQFGSGTGLSDADREYAEKIVGGKITLTEDAIKRLMAINEKAFKNVIKRYNKKAEQAMSRPGAESLPYDLRIDYNLEDDESKPRFKILKVQ